MLWTRTGTTRGPGTTREEDSPGRDPSPDTDPDRVIAMRRVLIATTAAALVALGCGGETSSDSGSGDGGTAGAGRSLGTVPDVTVRDLDGGEHDLRSVLSGPTVVNFWATWCGPCRREMPELVELREELADRGVEVIGIAVDSGSPEEIRSFAEDHGVEYPLFRASRNWATRHFGLFGMPMTLIVDGDGEIHEQLVGPQTKESLTTALRPLL